MTGPGNNGRAIRKIAVAFDPACCTPALLDVAAAFATSLGAELEALFVDDPDISRLSRLPFGRIIQPTSGKAEMFDHAAMQSRRAGPVARTRTVLRHMSQLHRFAYSVRELPGRALIDVATECTAELLVVASFHGKFGGARHVDEDAQHVAAQSTRSVLLVSQFPISTQRILVVADDNAVGLRALDIATRVGGPVGADGKNGAVRMTPGADDSATLAGRIRDASPTLVVIGLADRALQSALQEQFRQEEFSLLTVR